jgi:hypothetical protein
MMMKKFNSKFKFALLGLACGLALLAPSRSYAALIAGSLLNLSGNGNVGATFLNWNCNAAGGPAICPANSVTGAATGDFSVAGSTGTFAQYNGSFGFETDISQATAPLNTPFSLPNFITFALNANETIELTFIGLGTDTPSTTCVGLTHCTPQIGDGLISPTNPLGLSSFNLDQIGADTTAAFVVMGIIHDSSGATAPITGVYTAPFVGQNPAQVLSAFASAGGTGLNKSYAGNLSFTIVPEPMTSVLLGSGLLAFGLILRRRKRSS